MTWWKQLLLSAAVLMAGGAATLIWIPGAPKAVEGTPLVPLARQLAAALGKGPGEAAPADRQPGQPAGSGTRDPNAAPLGQQGVAGRSGNGGGNGGSGGGGGGFAGGGGGGGFAGGRGGFGRQASVVVTPAGSQLLFDRVTALGTASAIREATLTAGANGTLVALDVAGGDVVKAGQVIARLDSDSQEIAFEKAQLAYDDARQTLERNRRLGQGNAVPASQIQQSELASKVAELALKSARHDLEMRSITAPFDGRIGLVAVNSGVTVTAQSVIAPLEDSSTLLVDFALPERLSGQIGPGDAVELVPVARPEESYQARISAVDARIDVASGTFLARAELANADGRLKAGMSMNVSLKFPGESFVSVDPLAIQWSTKGAYVWRLKADMTVERAYVKIVQRNTESVLVAGDVAQGDNIVTEGIDGLRDGATVTLAGAPGPDMAQVSAPAAETVPPGDATGKGQWKKNRQQNQGDTGQAGQPPAAPGN